MPTSEQQWFDFTPSAPAATDAAPQALLVAPRQPPPGLAPVLELVGEPEVVVRRSPKATRYRLSVGRDGEAVLTIPIRGSERQARQFLESQRDWLERTRQRLARLPRSAAVWTIGTRVLWRGDWCEIARAADATPHVALGGMRFRVRQHEGDLRPTLESDRKSVV